MSTITCTNFLPKVQLSHFWEQYLMAANGPFLELYDLEKYVSDDFDARDFEPIRVRIFESKNVEWFMEFEEGHVLAITSEFSKSKLSINACLVHRDTLLEGGYADVRSTHCLLEQQSRDSEYFIEAIPGNNEILLLTASTLTHFKYTTSNLSDKLDVEVEVIEEFELQSLLPSFYTNRCIHPLAIDSTSTYSIIISVGNSIVLLKRNDGGKWACRSMPVPEGSLLGTKRVKMIPYVEIAVIGGKYSTQFISTSFHQKGVSKDQLRILQQRIENVTTKAIAVSNRDDFACVYVIGEEDLALWKIQESTLQITGPWPFDHSSENIELKQMGNVSQRIQYQSTSSRANGTITYERTSVDFNQSQVVRSSPTAAIVINMRMSEDYDYREFLIISYESGCVKVLRTDDIIKCPMFSYMPLGRKKMPIDNLYPCWEFPLDPIAPLTRLTGLSNGIPIVFKLENGMWNSTEIVHPRKALYSRVKSKNSQLGSTIAIFFNRHDICFCLFDKEIQWREDRLNCEIKECYISSTIIAIVTDVKIIFVDFRGLMNKDDDETTYYNASVDFDMLGFDDDAKVHLFSAGLTSMTIVHHTDDENLFGCWLRLKNGVMRSVPLSQSAISRETSLNDVFHRPFEGKVTHLKDAKRRIIEIETDNHGHIFSLAENGILNRGEYLGDAKHRSSNIDLFQYFPKSAQIVGLLAIQGTEIDDEEIYVYARETENGDLLYLKDADTKDNMTTEPIPSNFGDKPVFGHFVGPKRDGRCVLYTTSTRRFGDIPELIQINARVGPVHTRECLLLPDSLSQPNKVVQLVRRRRMIFKKAIELRDDDDKPIYIATFDTYYEHASNTLFIYAGSSSGLISVTWGAISNEYSVGNFIKESAVSKVFFFAKEHGTEQPQIYGYIDATNFNLFQVDSETNTTKEVESFPCRYTMDDQNRNSKAVHSACTGVGIETHDIWSISDEQATLFSGRNLKFLQNVLRYDFSSWSGSTESIFLLSTQTTGISANIVFVVKEKCRIGILATLQTPNLFPDKIVFTELGRISKSKSIAIDGEVLDSSAQKLGEITVNIRLFIARRRSVKMSLLKLSIDSGSLKIVEHVKLGDIPTTISDPSHFVVTKEVPDRTTPKYGIISGTEGTQIVRICPNKLLLPTDEE